MQLTRPIVIDTSRRRVRLPVPLTERAIILRELRSNDADDRGAAICAVVRSLTEGKNVRPYLVDLVQRLGDRDEAVCLAAIDALGEIVINSRQSKRALFLVLRFARSNETLIKNAVFAVGWIAEQGINISFLDSWFIRLTANQNEEIANAAKWALGISQVHQRFIQ